VRFERGGQSMAGYKFTAPSEDPVLGSEHERRVTSLWSDPLIDRPETEMTGLTFARAGYARAGFALSRGIAPYVAVPAFLSRMFRHSAIYIRSDRGIAAPSDLRGKTVGVPEYQMSAAMWARGFLHEEFGVAPADMNWVQGGLEQPGRRDKFPLNLPTGFPLTAAPTDKSLSQMLADGSLDAIVTARRPSCFVSGHPQVRRLFPDYRSVECEYFKRTGIFPTMHAVGIRRELHEKHPWLAASIYKAFVAAKRIADLDLAETTALKIGLPWINAELDATREAMGDDFWSYGVAPNRKTLTAMARYSHQQSLAVRELSVEEMFPESTLNDTRV